MSPLRDVRPSRLLASLSFLYLLGCGGDGSGPTGPKGATPATIQAVTSYSGQFPTDRTLPEPAVFVVRDKDNNGVSGARVAFQASGGGSAIPAEGTTGSDGRIATAWTLGPGTGIQMLSGTVTGLAPATISADAFDPCLEIKSHSIGQTSTGSVTLKSCGIDLNDQSHFGDLYAFSIGTSGGYRFNVKAEFSAPFFLLLSPSAVTGTQGLGDSLEVKALLDNGGGSRQYHAFIGGGAGSVGGYRFSSSSISSDMEGCEDWVATKNIETDQQLTASDCWWDWEDGAYYVDLVRIWLHEGETLVVEMTSQDTLSLDPFLELLVYDSSLNLYNVIVSNDDIGEGNYDSRIEFTVGEGEAGFYFLGPSSAYPEEVGPYALSVSSTGAPASSPLSLSSGDLPDQLLQPDPRGLVARGEQKLGPRLPIVRKR